MELLLGLLFLGLITTFAIDTRQKRRKFMNEKHDLR
jgi:hypothetical protein